jgi:glutamyl-tRNA reductase
MLAMVGVSHRHAPLAVRERFAIHADALPAVRDAVAASFGAGAIVATCNRLELYVPGDHPPARLARFLCEAAGVDAGLGERYLQARRDEEAVRHLYAVAAGIDSMVIGESEILGQIRGAFSATLAARADTALLSRLFHTAIRVGRRARSETEIGRGALSTSSIAAQQARMLVPDLATAAVLVVGAGEAGRLAAASLAEHGVGSIAVSNRTASRADALAEQLGGRSVPYEDLGAALASADVVIAATNAPEPVLSAGRVASAVARREGSPMLIVDIGVPRAAEPSVGAIPGVTYRDIDDLQEVAAAHARARAAEVEAVEALVEEETARFLEWWAQLRIVPTIAALTERAEQLRRSELAKTLRRLDATPEQHEQLEAMTRALVRQVLHDPITTLRERGDRDVYVDAVRELFRLDDSTTPPDAGDGAGPA